MSKDVFSGVLKQSCRLLLVTVILHAQVTAQLDFAVKNKRKNSIALTVMNLRRRFVRAELDESEQSGSGYPGGVPGALSNQPAPANNAPISTPPANQNNRQQQASTTSNSGPRRTAE
ncbi:flagellar M-ring protein FliF C-terminal domain-containing protein [Escherichia coli]